MNITPVPGTTPSSPAPRLSPPPTQLTPESCTGAALSRLLDTLLRRGGLTIGTVAREFEVTPEAVRQYVKGRRENPSMAWFLRFARLCGATVTISFPSERP